MEREFLLGIDFGLYVDKTTYVSWLNLLQGLVMAKEKDCRRWRRTPRARAHAQPRTHRPAVHASQTARSQRARSSSPSRFALYPLSTSQYAPSENAEYHTPPRSGSKRSATDAFSPTSTSFPPVKAPRRPMNLSLDIPERSQGPPSSISPSEPLQHFSKLSLGASPSGVKPRASGNMNTAWPSTMHQPVVPQTLASAYRVEGPRSDAAPQVRRTSLYARERWLIIASELVLLFPRMLANRGGEQVEEGPATVPPATRDLGRLWLCRPTVCADGRAIRVYEPA